MRTTPGCMRNLSRKIEACFLQKFEVLKESLFIVSSQRYFVFANGDKTIVKSS